jgi:phosphate transport system substrate-binding protein
LKNTNNTKNTEKTNKNPFDFLGNFVNNKKGVSYVVSVLIVTVVVVVGALGIGVMQSSMQNQVADDLTAANAGDNAGAEILIAGSTTVQPLSDCLGALYSDKNGIRVTVQGGGSGAGVTSAGLGIVDLGASSSALNSNQKTAYPELQEIKVGGSAVAFIVSPKCGAVNAVTNKSTLKGCYDNGNCIISTVNGSGDVPGNVTKVYDRAEASGTEETVGKYFTGTGAQLVTKATGATGNQGVFDAVKGCATTCCLGFVDFGFVDSTVVTALNVSKSDDSGNYQPTSANIIDALKVGGTKYPNDGAGLTRPLLYVTNGAPSAVVQNFITFATTPGDKTNVHDAANCFTQTGTFAVWEFS